MKLPFNLQYFLYKIHSWYITSRTYGNNLFDFEHQKAACLSWINRIDGVLLLFNLNMSLSSFEFSFHAFVIRINIYISCTDWVLNRFILQRWRKNVLKSLLFRYLNYWKKTADDSKYVQYSGDRLPAIFSSENLPNKNNNCIQIIIDSFLHLPICRIENVFVS